MSVNQKENIISAASEKMRIAGIRSVSIDDICQQLGISKKTFYVYFETKDLLIEELLRRREKGIIQEVEQKTRGQAVIDILLNVMYIARNVKDVRQAPSLVYDLNKYYPKLYEAHIARMSQINHDIILKYLIQGQQEGFFRQDLDVELTAVGLSKLHQLILDQSVHSTQEQKEASAPIVKNMVDVMMRGIISHEGKLQVAERLKNKQ